ncbi:MAG: glycoside hydrolase family 97 N-terminal domain-containing protein, partial [Segetibacter sp.]
MQKIKNTLSLFILLLTLSQIINGQLTTSYKISSPDKLTSFEVGTNKDGNLMYHLLQSGQEVITWSALGFMMNDITAGERAVIKNKVQRSNKERFEWPLGEDDFITNNYNEVILSCQSSSLQYNLVARVFDGSVAFRYEIPQQAALVNNSKYSTATSLEGPWSEFKDIAPPQTNTYGSQSTMLIKVTGRKSTTIIFMADKWKPATQW